MDIDQVAFAVDTPEPIANGLSDIISASTYDEINISEASVNHSVEEKISDGISATHDGVELPLKPKQKRNKPTLSCLECVERKTKCDRGRPCLACAKRKSACEYTTAAKIIASTHRRNSSSKARFITKPPSKARQASFISSARPVLSPTSDSTWLPNGRRAHRKSWSSAGSPPSLLSNVPYSKSSPSNVFGVGSQHPFSNYWTCQGGLPEVISVLPSKDQADILIAKYFEAVDPVYPFLHRQSFYADYERFWSLPNEEKNEADASYMALHYAMYALGTQFMEFPSYEERSQTAEFYASAANQSLRVYSYLNRTSMRAIQAMLLMSYFLMNDNHASDAYAWAGIHLRQAYAMRLNRDPDVVVPEASVLEKQQRRKLWQAVFFHDTFLTILLKLPPTATHSDVPVESLADEHELSIDGLDTCLGVHSRVENLMSINVIAPQSFEPPMPPMPHHILDPAIMQSDVVYMRSMWHLGNMVQENLSSPTSLSLPLANSPRQKDSLITAFKRLYKSFPAHLTTLDFTTLQQQSATRPRAVRQNLSLTSNYFHCLMLLHASANPAQKVVGNALEALRAAHEALWAFFKLWALFENEAGVWWVFQHRAFEESLLVAHLLATPRPPAGRSAEEQRTYDQAKDDIVRMMEIMERYGGNLEMHKTRKEVLHEAFENIAV
nr:putative transcriptional regulatory protein [Quercus suber]